ncbi:MAG: bifunctional DNA-formamidopyrimidine glycosylase/DNA-(apurinic or apyrimidinic site) lyase [Candidatus Cloacimonetes bacterium]|nr:bifunctional DNA-formamidopyrimidine glycosylase/DNA-(apurinic or apyrimidinic site) lyase [Candidatus Cloacimonadota bacterium]
MPELPEVETTKNDLIDLGFIGQEIVDFKCHWDNILENDTCQNFKSFLVHEKLLKLWRRAKYIVFELSNSKYLVVHLRMTGQFAKPKLDYEHLKHEHVHIQFEDNRWLVYKDTRKFGKFTIVSDIDAYFKHLGPEPLLDSFTDKIFDQCLGKTKGNIKSRLLNQLVVAGLGNIYVDEALYLSHILPTRMVKDVKPFERKLLRKSIQKVLSDGLDNMGTSLGTGEGNYLSVSGRRGQNKQRLKVFRREGLECFDCKSIILKVKLASRGTHYCPKCQS